MTSFVDRRRRGQVPSEGNRQRYLNRNRKVIRDKIREHLKQDKLRDIKDREKLSVPIDPTEEPTFTYDPTSGDSSIPIVNNDQFNKGHKQPKPPQQKGGGGGGGSRTEGGMEGCPELQLTKDELRKYLFDELQLPAFVKQSFDKVLEDKWRRQGIQTEGVLSNLNVPKTMIQAKGRRVAWRAKQDPDNPKKIPYLEEIDLRYDRYVQESVPIRKGVVFCLMDVSGSMTDELKYLAKRFFILMVLFLDYKYDSIDIRFVRHTEVADEVDEDTFFHQAVSGGTAVSSGMQLINDIIEKDYDLHTTNIYIAQASDGENWGEKGSTLRNALIDNVLPKIQYLAYLEVTEDESLAANRFFNAQIWGHDSIANVYLPLKEEGYPVGVAKASAPNHVWEAFAGLFNEK